MKVTIILEIDVFPNDIDQEDLEKELQDNKKDLKNYFQNNEDHWLNGLQWEGIKVKNISKNL